MVRVAWNEFSHHDRRTENSQQLRDYYISTSLMERKERKKGENVFENRPDNSGQLEFPCDIIRVMR